MQAVFNISPLDFQLLVAVRCEILLVDFKTQTVSTFFDGATADRALATQSYHDFNESYYGLTFNEEQKLIYAIGTKKNIVDSRRSKTQLCVLNFNGDLIHHINIRSDLCFNRAHQIKYHDGFIWVTDTGHNCIQKIHPVTGHGSTLVPHMDYFGRDFHHINSINFYDDKMYILMHGDRESFSHLMEFSYPNLKYITTYEYKKEVYNAHNIIKLSNDILIGNSPCGTLIDTNNAVKFKFNHFLRGLCMVGFHIIAGGSQMHRRENRIQNNDAWLYVKNIFGGNDLGYVQLKNVGQIHEIMELRL